MGSLVLSSARMGQTSVLLSLLVVVTVQGSVFNHHQQRNNPASQEVPRRGKQSEIDGTGIDFTGCTTNPETGFCCIEKTESVSSLKKDPILECTHKNTEQCHYTYVTQFKPSVEEICEETFEKQCQITFKKQAFNETVEHCYKPIEKVCNGQRPEECRLFMSLPAQPSMWRNNQESLLETLLVRSFLWRSVELDVLMKKVKKSVMRKSLLL